MPLHALVEETDARPVVRLLLELECAAILHEFSELRGVSATQLLKRRLNLFLLNGVILLILAAFG